MDELERQLTEQQQRFFERDRTAHSAEETCARLQERLRHLEAVLTSSEGVKSETVRLHEQLHDLALERDRLQRDLAAESKRCTSKDTTIEELRTQISQLQMRHEATVAVHHEDQAKLRAELEADKQMFDIQRRDWEGKMDEMRASVVAAKVMKTCARSPPAAADLFWFLKCSATPRARDRRCNCCVRSRSARPLACVKTSSASRQPMPGCRSAWIRCVGTDLLGVPFDCHSAV